MDEGDPYLLGRYAASPLDFGPRALWRIFLRILSNVVTHRLSLMAAGVAFFSLMSLFPALAALVFFYGLFSSVDSLAEHLAALADVMPADTFAIVQGRMQELVSADRSGLSFGFVVSLAIAVWSGSRGVSALVEMIGASYEQPDGRHFAISALLSVALMFGGMVTMVLMIAVIAAIPIVLAALPLPDVAGRLLRYARWPVLALFSFAALGILYRIAPDRRPARWRWVAPGAALATLLLILASAGFSLYVQNFANFGATFGSLSAIIVLMLWLYYSAFIVGIGAELNAQMESQTAIDTTAGPPRPRGERGAHVADETHAPPL